MFFYRYIGNISLDSASMCCGLIPADGSASHSDHGEPVHSPQLGCRSESEN